MHIIIEKVAYPIDWELLKIPALQIAVGIKFKIGELEVTPNRENIRYTDDSILLIKERINNTYKELVEIYKNQNKPYESFKDWSKNKTKRPCISFTDTCHLYLNNIKELDKKVRYKYFKHLYHLYDIDIIEYLYDYQFTIINSKVKDGNNVINYDSFNYDIILFSNNKNNSNVKNFYHKNKKVIKKVIKKLPTDVFISNYKKRLSYDESSYNATNVELAFIVESTKSTNYFKFGNGKTYFLLGSSLLLYKAIKKIREELEVNIKNYDDIPKEAYKEYTEYRKSINSTLLKKLQGKISVKNVNTATRTDLTIAEIEKFTGLVIYGNAEDSFKLKKSVEFILNFKTLALRYKHNYDKYINPKAVKVILINRENNKYFMNKKNMVNVNELYGDNKLFRKLASCYKIEEFFNNYLRNQSLYTKDFITQITNISKDIGECLSLLVRFRNENHNNEENSKELKREIIEIATSFNLFDPVIESVLVKVENWFKDVPLLKYTNINENSLPIVLSYLREKKKRINFEYYCKYIPEVVERIEKDKNAQIIIMFPEETSNENKTKFEILTKNIT